MNYYLFSAVSRCQPCRVLIDLLDHRIPNWKEKITYVDIDTANLELRKLAVKLGIMRIPAFSTDEKVLPSPMGYMDIYKQIKEICTKE